VIFVALSHRRSRCRRILRWGASAIPSKRAEASSKMRRCGGTKLIVHSRKVVNTCRCLRVSFFARLRGQPSDPRRAVICCDPRRMRMTSAAHSVGVIFVGSGRQTVPCLSHSRSSSMSEQICVCVHTAAG